MRRLALCLLWVGLTGSLGAQAAPATSPVATQAVPYTDQEFAPWVLKLRRAEVLAIGTFPLAYLFAGLGYDYYYYLTTGFNQANAPWPAGPGTSQWTVAAQGNLLQQKNLTLVGASVVASLALAGVDWLLGEGKR